LDELKKLSETLDKLKLRVVALGTYFFGTSNAKFKISGLGFEKSFTGFRSAWVPPTICIYDGPTQKEGVVTIEVEPAAKGETKFDLDGVISVCRE